MISPFRLFARAAVTWAAEVAFLYLMLRLLPTVHVTAWEFALLAVLVMGLLNAMVRPGILLLAANLGLIPFLIVALALNGMLVQVTSWLVPGFWVDGLLSAFAVAFGMAGVNTVLTGLLSVDDDDAFYRNVVRRIAQRTVPAADDLEETGAVIVQIDGLAEPILRRALAEGRMPTLASWLAAGSHRLIGWKSEIPSMTTSAQAGILHGSNGGVPAFYWYEKRGKRLMSSANPHDLHAVQQRISDGHGLLHRDGVSVTNLFSGDAEHSVMTVGTLLDDEGSIHADPHDFYGYLVSPYNLYRGLIGLIFEAALECWQCLRQWAENRQPRIRRFGLFTLQRGLANVILRDATTWTVVASMFRGHRVIYCDYLSYDEVGHFAGPETPDAVATLYAMDRQLRQIALAAREAPRAYQIVVLSDHGQTTAPIFQAKYGETLDEVVRRAIDAGPTVRVSGGKGETPGYLSAFLSEMSGAKGLRGRGARRLLRTKRGSGLIDPVREGMNKAASDDVEIVVTSSGSLAHIYFAKVPDKLTLEEIAAGYPGLIETLVAHEGVGLVIVRSESRGTLVLSEDGIRELRAEHVEDGVVEGRDPLAEFEPYTARFLDDLAQFEQSGDIIVNGTFDPSTGWVIGFDDLVGAHGGVGGMQTQPFIVYPAGWTDEPPEIIGSVGVHRFLREYTGGATANDPAPRIDEQPIPASPRP
ncbi:MAG: phage holin family protein [Chloroflexi bacterium]|nr:phage holin family protein [Chloroflexota bacterium]